MTKYKIPSCPLQNVPAMMIDGARGAQKVSIVFRSFMFKLEKKPIDTHPQIQAANDMSHSF